MNILIMSNTKDKNRYIDQYGVEYEGDEIYSFPKTFCGVYEIPNSVTYLDFYFFEDCPELVALIIPASVESIYFDNCIERGFYNCKKFASIYVDSKNPVYKAVDGVLYADNRLLFCPPAKSGVLHIPSFMTNFLVDDHDCIELQYIHNITKFDATDNDYFVVQNDMLFNKDMTILHRCLQSIAGEVVVPPTVTEIRWNAFNGCNKITKVTLPQYVWLEHYNTWDALRNFFADCDSLIHFQLMPTAKHGDDEELTIENGYLTRYGYLIAYPALYDAENSTNLLISDNIYHINRYAFFHNRSLKNVRIDLDYSDCESFEFSIDSNAFRGCQLLEYLSIGGYKEVSIGDKAFADCPKLTTIHIDEEVTYIGENAFANTAYYNDSTNWQNHLLIIDGCLIAIDSDYKSEVITLPDNIRLIAADVFTNSSIKKVIIPEGITDLIINDSVWGPMIKRRPQKLYLPQSIQNIKISYFFSEIFIPVGTKNYYIEQLGKDFEDKLVEYKAGSENVGQMQYHFQAGASAQGYIYKNYETFYNSSDAVCYIPESTFTDDNNKIQKTLILNREQLKNHIALGKVWTRNTICKKVRLWGKQGLKTEYKDSAIFEDFVNYIANKVFDVIDWQSPTSYLKDLVPNEEWDEFLPIFLK